MKHTNVLISLCLVLAVSAVIAYVYIGPKGSEGSNILESRVNDLESRVSEQLLIIEINYYSSEPQSVSFMMMHMGTAEVTISEIRVNDVLNSSSPGWVGNRTLIPGQMGQITLYGLKYFADGFEDDVSHQVRFITARGNSFYCMVLYEGGTPSMSTEELKIVSLTWNDNNATFTVINTGTADLTIVEVRVNDEYATMNPSSVTLDPGDQTIITVTRTEGFISGVKYEFRFITATGNAYFYTATAP